MTGSATRWWVLGVALVVATPAFAQSSSGFRMQPVAAKYVAPQGELHGLIHDERGKPLPNAIISASGLGSSSMFVLSDHDGRFAFRSLRPGSYLVRAYLAGYASPSDSYVQVSAGARQVSDIALNKVAVTQVLQAGVGGAPAPAAAEAGSPTDNHDGGAVPYWMRRLPRGVLKDAYTAAIDRDDHPLEGLVPPAAAAVSKTPRLLTIFDTVNGQVNLLTSTSFSRPQDLFDATAGAPRPIAYVSLVAPLSTGDWAIRGSMTEGDIASWILAGSFTRHSVSSHTYQVGLSYATQRYQGANADSLTSMRDGSRNVGEISIDDSWAIVPRLVLATGGRYANYDYLSDRVLLGGRLSIGYQVVPTDPLKVRVTAAHRELAPGAEEFAAPAAAGLWLPPERTFSPLSRNGQLEPEKVDTVELSSERPVGRGVVVGVRAFRQQVDNQLVTLFGSMLQGPSLGHYRVASGGDFENYGWGATLSRQIGLLHASLDYTMTDTQRRGFSTDARLLRFIAPATLRRDENVHDLTASVDSHLDATGTGFLVVYKLNNSYADLGTRLPETGARFDIQVNQEMPYLNFTGARWEMLVGVRNLFRSDVFEGSVYDELLVVRPPTRITGGITVRF